MFIGCKNEYNIMLYSKVFLVGNPTYTYILLRIYKTV